MALENLISISFTDEETQQAGTGIDALKSLFEGKCVTLTPEQRKTYGRLGDRNANWVKKVIDYTDNQPNFNPAFLNKGEMDKDYLALSALMPLFNRIDAVHDMMDDTLLVIGNDLYMAALVYYRNIKMLAHENVPGAKAIYDDLSSQFPGR